VKFDDLMGLKDCLKFVLQYTYVHVTTRTSRLRLFKFYCRSFFLMLQVTEKRICKINIFRTFPLPSSFLLPHPTPKNKNPPKNILSFPSWVLVMLFTSWVLVMLFTSWVLVMLFTSWVLVMLFTSWDGIHVLFMLYLCSVLLSECFLKSQDSWHVTKEGKNLTGENFSLSIKLN